MVLICQVIFQDQLPNEPFEFKGRIPSNYVTILPSLVDIGILVVGI